MGHCFLYQVINSEADEVCKTVVNAVTLVWPVFSIGQSAYVIDQQTFVLYNFFLKT